MSTIGWGLLFGLIGGVSNLFHLKRQYKLRTIQEAATTHSMNAAMMVIVFVVFGMLVTSF